MLQAQKLTQSSPVLHDEDGVARNSENLISKRAALPHMVDGAQASQPKEYWNMATALEGIPLLCVSWGYFYSPVFWIPAKQDCQVSVVTQLFPWNVILLWAQTHGLYTFF